MLSFHQLCSLVEQESLAMAAEENIQNLLILDDAQAYDMCIASGIDPEDPAVAAATAAARPGAQCFSGVVEEIIRAELATGNIPAANLPLLERVFGHLVIWVDSLAAAIGEILTQSSYNPSEEEQFARMFVRATIAHERRHELQSRELFQLTVREFRTAEDVRNYLRQPHEADAYTFQRAFMRRECRYQDAATWQPTDSQLQLAQAGVLW